MSAYFLKHHPKFYSDFRHLFSTLKKDAEASFNLFKNKVVYLKTKSNLNTKYTNRSNIKIPLNTPLLSNKLTKITNDAKRFF